MEGWWEIDLILHINLHLKETPRMNEMNSLWYEDRHFHVCPIRMDMWPQGRLVLRVSPMPLILLCDQLVPLPSHYTHTSCNIFPKDFSGPFTFPRSWLQEPQRNRQVAACAFCSFPSASICPLGNVTMAVLRPSKNTCGKKHKLIFLSSFGGWQQLLERLNLGVTSFSIKNV